MQVLVNGEPRELEPETTVSELLRELELDAVRVALELNRRLVPRAEHAGTRLSDGDRLEIVTLVGGG